MSQTDDNNNTFDEAVPDIRLKDGLHIHKLQFGEAHKYEVADDDDKQSEYVDVYTKDNKER